MISRRKSRGKAGPAARRKPLGPAEKAAAASRVREVAEPLCEAEAMELVHVEYQQESQGKILRLYIDKPGGVTLEDCARISRRVADLLEVGFEPDESYRLEVSSPGPDRPIGRPADFERFKGKTARIKTSQPLEGQKSFTGVLLGLSEGTVRIMTGDRTVAIPLEEVTKARLLNYSGENGC